MTKEEQMLLKHFSDLSDRAYAQSRPCFTDFLDMNSQNLLLSYFKGPLPPVLEGGYDMAERRIAVFSEIPARLPAIWLEIVPAYPKYAQKLSHRDYLGSILGLGLERSCIGDILTDGKGAKIICLDRVKDFIQQELVTVSRTSVRVQEISLPEEVILPEFEVCRGTVSSVRLDAVIALAYHLSRAASCRLIEAGQVYINGRLNTSNGAVLKDGDRISVRHKGKFIFVDSKNKSKKNKCMIEVHKYI